ncbi:MAG: hypothetical protein Q8L27_03950 [archaeon]|nr:hypothetical protein [archaeon]
MAFDQLFLSSVSANYRELITLLPSQLKIIPPLIVLTLIIAIYAFFVLFFYKVLAKRDLITVNLAKYNSYKHSGELKILAFIFYTIRYLLLTPVLIMVWFVIFSIFLIVLAKSLDVATVMLVSAGLVSAIRLVAYFDEGLSEDVAKLFPLTLLTGVIITPGFFDVQTTFSRLLEIPLFFNNVLYYLLFILVLETILRIIHLPHVLLGPEDVQD